MKLWIIKSFTSQSKQRCYNGYYLKIYKWTMIFTKGPSLTMATFKGINSK